MFNFYFWIVIFVQCFLSSSRSAMFELRGSLYGAEAVVVLPLSCFSFSLIGSVYSLMSRIRVQSLPSFDGNVSISFDLPIA